MKNKRNLGILCIVLIIALIAIGYPWLKAYQKNQMLGFPYGSIGGHDLVCLAVDGTHFDRYHCVIYDNTIGERISCEGADILLDGQKIKFPVGNNCGFIKADGSMTFTTVTNADIQPAGTNAEAVYYLFGKVPSCKEFTFGNPTREYVENNVGTSETQ